MGSGWSTQGASAVSVLVCCLKNKTRSKYGSVLEFDNARWWVHEYLLYVLCSVMF